MEKILLYDEVIGAIPDEVLNRTLEFEGTTATIRDVIKDNLVDQEVLPIAMEDINTLTSLELNESRYIWFYNFKRIE